MVTGRTIDSFDLRLPRQTVFGRGEIRRLGGVAAGFGKRALLVTGNRFLAESGALARIQEDLKAHDVSWVQLSASGEPDVEAVDGAARKGIDERCDMVIAVGGGSVLDLGKAAAGMIPNAGSITEYLEGAGKAAVMKNDPVPFIAAPTTAGTGSEATRNAVIKGPGCKKSFRDPRLVPPAAIVDPDLTATCPPDRTASAGMDAVTQLVESLTSIKAHPVTDMLALSGLDAAGWALPSAVENGGDAGARAAMAYASFLSGLALSHAGLGAVHGLASPLGGLFSIPHSAACARLLPLVTRANLAALNSGRGFAPALDAYRRADKALGCDITRYCARFRFPGLASFGMKESDIPTVVGAATSGSMKTNPVELTPGELAGILKEAM